MRLFSKNWGSGHPLIILHGLFGSLENWETFGKALAKCYRVFALDLRGHGQSPHDSDLSYEAMAGDLYEFMRAKRMSSAFLLGHSMGGKCAMRFALDHPERVDKLVVVDIAPRAYLHHFQEVLEALDQLDPGVYRTRTEMDAALARGLADESLRQFLLKNVVRDDSGRFQWRIDLQAIGNNMHRIDGAVESNRRFENPSLFVRGALSPYIKTNDAKGIKELFPAFRIVTIPGVGHWVPSQARSRIARVVSAFLAGAE